MSDKIKVFGFLETPSFERRHSLNVAACKVITWRGVHPFLCKRVSLSGQLSGCCGVRVGL